MNNSGVVLQRLLKKYRLTQNNLLVVCDNLDLPPGACRLKKGGGDAGHNGLKSIIAALGSTDFLRMYIGIGHPGKRSEIVDWVLGAPGRDDSLSIREAVEKASASIDMILNGDVGQVMNELNRKR